MSRTGLIVVCSIAASITGAASIAGAADGSYAGDGELTPGQTVIERPRPEVEALGGRAGGFLIFPSLSLTEQYDDNVFATTDNTSDDFITLIRPSLQAQSDWNNHQLNLFGWGNVARYASETNENWEDVAGGGDYRHDILRGTRANVGFKMARLHEERSSPDDVNGVEPTTYTLMEPNVGVSHRFGRFRVGVDGALRRFDFNDVDAAGGTEINNDDRDRDEWRGGVRLGYEIRPEYEAFVRGDYNVRNYSDAVDDGGVNRDSDGYEISVGTRIDFTDLIVGEVYVGYRSQEFDDATLSSVSGVGGGVDLTWNVTRLTSVTAFLTRSIEETTQAGASGFFATRLGARVDHELLRNLLIGASALYSNYDFENVARSDDGYGAGAHVKYLTNRYLDLSARYRYSKRESDAGGVNYDKNVFLVQATAKY